MTLVFANKATRQISVPPLDPVHSKSKKYHSNLLTLFNSISPLSPGIEKNIITEKHKKQSQHEDSRPVALAVSGRSIDRSPPVIKRETPPVAIADAARPRPDLTAASLSPQLAVAVAVTSRNRHRHGHGQRRAAGGGRVLRQAPPRGVHVAAALRRRQDLRDQRRCAWRVARRRGERPHLPQPRVLRQRTRLLPETGW